MRSDDLEDVLRPIAQANGLSNRHYVDDQVFELETDRLLKQQWAAIAVASDVPERGDAKPIDFMDEPLLLLRDRSGTIRVYQNICRHRGMILVEEPRRIEGAIRCPYHSWCYSTEGDLVATPHVGGPGQNACDGIDKKTLGLIEVRSHVWMDIVWINISGTAPPFEVLHAELIERWAEFDQPMYHGGDDSRFHLDVGCNWKLAVENYCESYHLPWVHPDLNTYSRLEDHYHIEARSKFSGQGTLVYRQLTGASGEVFPDFADLSDQWDTGAEYIAVYPNVLIGTHRDHFYSILLLPQGRARTREEVNIYYSEPEPSLALKAQNTAQWRKVFEEDVFVVEGMQRGRNASLFDGGRFSPVMDGPTHVFHAWVAEKLTDPDKADRAAE